MEPKVAEYIYYEPYFDRSFRQLFFNYIYGILSENHLEATEVDFEMFLIIFTTTMMSINSISTSDMVFYHKDDLRQIYFGYFKMKVVTSTSQETLNKIISRMRSKIVEYDLSPTDVDFENCIDLIKEGMPEAYLDQMSDIIAYKWSYFKESYYNIVRILHGMRGYR